MELNQRMLRGCVDLTTVIEDGTSCCWQQALRACEAGSLGHADKPCGL